ncbi:RING-type E3 ubiquitin transferase [Ranunculus cassubicifolius]
MDWILGFWLAAIICYLIIQIILDCKGSSLREDSARQNRARALQPPPPPPPAQQRAGPPHSIHINIDAIERSRICRPGHGVAQWLQDTQKRTPTLGYRESPWNQLCNMTDCVICLDELSAEGRENTVLVVLECNHIFHKDCILQWSHRTPTCPICRTAIASN